MSRLPLIMIAVFDTMLLWRERDIVIDSLIKHTF